MSNMTANLNRKMVSVVLLFLFGEISAVVNRQGCVQEWSPYINENHPDGHNLGDKEINATEYKIRNPSFCRYGIITKAECWDIDIDASHYSSGAQMACSAERGLICNNADNFPIQCDDYKIRFFCRCAPAEFKMNFTPGTVEETRPTTTLAQHEPTKMFPGCDDAAFFQHNFILTSSSLLFTCYCINYR